MPTPVSPAPSGKPPQPTPSPVALRAQLVRAEAQLADCVACDSADTQQGQARIQALARQVQRLRLQLDAVPPAEPVSPPQQAHEPGSGHMDLTV